MNITIKKNFGLELIIEADNVKIHEDMESRIYPKDENGKSIINLNPKRDIKDEYMDMFCTALQDMAYYREAEYDSSAVIQQLFDKLPESAKIQMNKYISSEVESI